MLRESCDEYYTADSLNTLFEKIPETCIVEFLWEAGFFYLIWMVRHSIQSLTWTIPKLKQFFNFMYTTSDINGHISSTILDLNELATDIIPNLTTPPDLFVEDKLIWENPTCEGRLIYPEGCVLSLNKSNPTISASDSINFDGILPKGPYPPCLRMADRALLVGYHHIAVSIKIYFTLCYWTEICLPTALASCLIWRVKSYWKI